MSDSYTVLTILFEIKMEFTSTYHKIPVFEIDNQLSDNQNMLKACVITDRTYLEQ